MLISRIFVSTQSWTTRLVSLGGRSSGLIGGPIALGQVGFASDEAAVHRLEDRVVGKGAALAETAHAPEGGQVLVDRTVAAIDSLWATPE